MRGVGPTLITIRLNPRKGRALSLSLSLSLGLVLVSLTSAVLARTDPPDPPRVATTQRTAHLSFSLPHFSTGTALRCSQYPPTSKQFQQPPPAAAALSKVLNRVMLFTICVGLDGSLHHPLKKK